MCLAVHTVPHSKSAILNRLDEVSRAMHNLRSDHALKPLNIGHSSPRMGFSESEDHLSKTSAVPELSSLDDSSSLEPYPNLKELLELHLSNTSDPTLPLLQSVKKELQNLQAALPSSSQIAQLASQVAALSSESSSGVGLAGAIADFQTTAAAQKVLLNKLSMTVGQLETNMTSLSASLTSQIGSVQSSLSSTITLNKNSITQQLNALQAQVTANQQPPITLAPVTAQLVSLANITSTQQTAINALSASMYNMTTTANLLPFYLTLPGQFGIAGVLLALAGLALGGVAFNKAAALEGSISRAKPVARPTNLSVKPTTPAAPAAAVQQAEEEEEEEDVVEEAV